MEHEKVIYLFSVITVFDYYDKCIIDMMLRSDVFFIDDGATSLIAISAHSVKLHN